MKNNGGNFLGLVKLLGKYDTVMAKHLRSIQSKKIHDHYLRKTIQNILGNKTENAVINRMKIAKLFSVILGCTTN
ncbi:hypothetical protein PR048_021789, partial [Dryococelus australis]